MSDYVYEAVELTGSSTEDPDEAIGNTIVKATKTLHNLRWFEVTDIRGHIEDGAIARRQVSLRVGFSLDA